MGQEVTAATPKGIKALRAEAMGMREEGGFRGAVLGGRVDRMWSEVVRGVREGGQEGLKVMTYLFYCLFPWGLPLVILGSLWMTQAHPMLRS